MNQGIGQTQSANRTKGGGFSDGYSEGFDIILD
jgi:hypothetical protein